MKILKDYCQEYQHTAGHRRMIFAARSKLCRLKKISAILTADSSNRACELSTLFPRRDNYTLPKPAQKLSVRESTSVYR
jgi:hypothetical protein